MKTHFFFARDHKGKEIWIYIEHPKWLDTQKVWCGDWIHIIERNCDFYKKLRPILSKIAPGKCKRVLCDLKVVK